MQKVKMLMLAAGILILAGCGNKAANNSTGPSQNAGPEKSGIISSIKDAMGLGQTMKCTYQIKNGENSLGSTAYVNGQKYLAENTIAGNIQKTLFDGETMYSWSEKDKKGTKFTKSCMEELSKNTPQNSQEETAVPDTTGEKTFDNALDVKCEPASADFSVPADVTFTDQCEMMKNLLKSIPSVPTNLPSNIPSNIPTNIPQNPSL